MKAKKSEKKKGLGALAEVKLPPREVPAVEPDRVVRIPLRDIRPDPDQPRRLPPPGPALDAAIADITSSITWDLDAEAPVDGRDIITAIEVRATTVEADEPWTIVDGERRYRAAKANGFESIRATVITIAPADVLARQVLHASGKPLAPLEMADAVARLAKPEKGKRKGPSPADIAERIGLGKLPRPVHEYLALAGLGAVARAALEEGRLASTRVALELAGIAEPEEQQKAAEEVSAQGARRGMATAEALRWIREKYHRRLKASPFDTGSATLLPAAGACSSCPHNTASQAALFAEDDGDARCTKPKCWATKLEAHRAAEGEVGAMGASEHEAEEREKGKRGKKDPKLSEVLPQSSTPKSNIEPTRPTREQIERLSDLLARDAAPELPLSFDEHLELGGLEAIVDAWTAFRAPSPKCCTNPAPRVDVALSVFCGACLGELAPAPVAPPAIPDPPAAPSRFSALSAAEGARILVAFNGARASFPFADWKALVEGLDAVIAERPIVAAEGSPSEVREETAPAPSARCPVSYFGSPCEVLGSHDVHEANREEFGPVRWTGETVKDAPPAEEPIEARCRAHLLAACTDSARVAKWLEGDAVAKGFPVETVRAVWQKLKDEQAVKMVNDRWQKAPSYEPAAEVAP